MNVLKLIRPTADTVKLCRKSQTVQLINTRGVVYYGGGGDAATVTMNTNLKDFYNLQKQL